MNQYGRLAQEHWQNFRPSRIAEIDDSEAFFTELGIDVRDEVRRRWTAKRLASPGVPGESFLARAGRLQQVHHGAEGEVPRQFVLLSAADDVDLVNDPHFTAADLAEEGWRDQRLEDLLAGRSRHGEFTAENRARLRARAPLAALRVLRQIRKENREATGDEKPVLARWSSWGAVPNVFDPSRERTNVRREQCESVQAQRRELLSEKEYADARRTTLSAHNADAAGVRVAYLSLRTLGSGAGTFVGMAAEGAEMTGVELARVTRAISQALYPQARVLNEGFQNSPVNTGEHDAAIDNVPFHSAHLTDPQHDLGNFPMHDHFIIKALDGVRVGGAARFRASAGSMGETSMAARTIRLPRGAHAAVFPSAPWLALSSAGASLRDLMTGRSTGTTAHHRGDNV